MLYSDAEPVPDDLGEVFGVADLYVEYGFDALGDFGVAAGRETGDAGLDIDGRDDDIPPTLTSRPYPTIFGGSGGASVPGYAAAELQAVAIAKMTSCRNGRSS